MNDSELDRLLDSSARPVPAGALKASVDLAAGPRPTAATQRRQWSRGAVAGAVALGVVLLTGAGTITAHQLDIPPFQTLEPGLVRVPTAVPVVWVRDDGVTVRCLAFMELRGADTAEVEALDDYISGQDWDGYGESLAGPAARVAGAPAPGTVAEALDDDLYRRARRVIPGLTLRSFDSDTTYTGEAVSCTYHP